MCVGLRRVQTRRRDRSFDANSRSQHSYFRVTLNKRQRTNLIRSSEEFVSFERTLLGVCVCVCVCMRARARTCVLRVSQYLLYSLSFFPKNHAVYVLIVKNDGFKL